MINRVCNLACQHCAVFDNPFVKLHDDIRCQAHIEAVVAQAIDLGIEHTVISGGEPTLSPWLIPTFDALRAGGLTFSLSTNGTNLSERLAQSMQGAGLRQATVSLDGGTASVHDRLRGDHAFDAALEGIRNLVDASIDVSVGSFLHRDLVESLPDLLELLPALGVAKLGLLAPICQGRHRAPPSEESSLLFRRASELIAQHPSAIELTFFEPECGSASCPSGQEIFGAIGAELFPFCIYKGDVQRELALAVALA